MEAGFLDEDELRTLNRFRCHQQVLYLSDILEANGKTLNNSYLQRRQSHKTWSTILFPNENPPNRHLGLWRSALDALVPQGRLDHWLGAFKHNSHTVKEWTYDSDAQELYHRGDGTMDIYQLTTHPRNAHRTNYWLVAQRGVEDRDRGDFCSVKEV